MSTQITACGRHSSLAQRLGDAPVQAQQIGADGRKQPAATALKIRTPAARRGSAASPDPARAPRTASTSEAPSEADAGAAMPTCAYDARVRTPSPPAAPTGRGPHARSVIEEQADGQSRHASSVAPVSRPPDGFRSVGHGQPATVTLQIHRAERTDLLADGLGGAAGDAAGRPVRRGGRRRPGPGRRAVADPAAVPPPRGRRARRRRGVRRRPVPQPALARRAAARQGARRPLGPRPAGVAAAGRHRRRRSASRGAARWPRTSATASRARRACCGASRRYSVARRLAGLFAWYAVQRPALVTDWREGRDTDGAGGPVDGDLAWQPELWRRLRRPRRRSAAGRAARGDVGAAARGRRRAGPPAAAVAVRAHPAAGDRGGAARRAGGAARRAPVAAAGRPTCCGTSWRELSAPGRCCGREDPSIRSVGHPLLGVAGARRARAAADTGAGVRRLRPTSAASLASSTNGRDVAARLAAGGPARATPSRMRRPARAGCSTPTTGRCRCTPATARPARSTCSARCWSGCSRTTRRSSRATSW